MINGVSEKSTAYNVGCNAYLPRIDAFTLNILYYNTAQCSQLIYSPVDTRDDSNCCRPKNQTWILLEV